MSNTTDWNSLDKSVLDYALQGLPVPVPSFPGQNTQVLVYHMLYCIRYSIRYRIRNSIQYSIKPLFLTLSTFLQDTLCLATPYPFLLEPLKDFDLLTDFDMTGGDDVGLHDLNYFFRATYAQLDR